VLEKSKFFDKKKNTMTKAKTNIQQFYAQVANSKVSNILKLKKNYPNLSAKKIENIHRIINNTDKTKSYIKIAIKGLLQKQIIISMSQANINKILAPSSVYVANINRALRNIKSNVIVDYIQPKVSDVIIVLNSIALASDCQVIENYVKNVDNIMSENIQAPRFPQSKSYLKIIRIPYLIKNTNIPINLEFVETVIKLSHIFNNLLLTSRPRVIKASSKSNMAIVWIDIWDFQSGKNARMLINRCFNMRSHIITICGANMNPGVP